jgi:hypothetical protein
MAVDESLQQLKLTRRFKLTLPRPLNIFIFIFTEKKLHPLITETKTEARPAGSATANRSR